MRLALACLITLPTASLADSFTLQSAPTAVTVYADAAVVERQVSLSLPQGAHEVVLTGLPVSLQPDLVRVSVTGATLGATEFRRDAVLPQPDPDSPAILAAKADIEAAETALRDLEDQVAETRLAAEAAEAKIAYLTALGGNEGLAADVATLRELAQMIGAETLAAEREALAANQAARDQNAARKDLEKALRDAQAALAALTPPPQEAAQLTAALAAPADGDVTITLSYISQANWQPVYDIYLTGEDDAATLDLRRGAMVQQWSGEAWKDVALTLSTFQLSAQVAPREVQPIPLVFGDQPQPAPKATTRMLQSDLAEGAAMMEAPVIAETAVANFDGPGVRYIAPQPVSIASGVDAARVALDTLTFDARRFARAAPRFDNTAFLMAGFTNTTQEPLLASFNAALYLDNTLIGRSVLEQVPAGAEAELAFGPLQDLQLSYTVLNENEGDRGFINRSNARSEALRMDIQNLGPKDWDVEVQAAVPYAVQEDLKIDWTASPAPDSQSVNDKRGVLQWLTTVPAGTTSSIEVETQITWPEGKVLR